MLEGILFLVVEMYDEKLTFAECIGDRLVVRIRAIIV